MKWPSVTVRLLSHIDTSGGADACWPWTSRIDRYGYGKFKWQRRDRIAHRVAYELLVGRTIPDDLTIDHLCRTRSCCNPLHMELVTSRENVQRGAAFRRREKRRAA